MCHIFLTYLKDADATYSYLLCSIQELEKSNTNYSFNIQVQVTQGVVLKLLIHVYNE